MQNGFRVTRITCLDCSNGGNSSLDLCVRCYDQDYKENGKDHRATHPLLQLRKVLSQRVLFKLLDAASEKLDAMVSDNDAGDAASVDHGEPLIVTGVEADVTKLAGGDSHADAADVHEEIPAADTGGAYPYPQACRRSTDTSFLEPQDHRECGFRVGCQCLGNLTSLKSWEWNASMLMFRRVQT